MSARAGLWRLADRVLRGEGATPAAAARTRGGSIALVITVFGMLYGAAMGAHGGVAGERAWQVVYSALKVPLMLLASFLLALPSFFVLNALAGLGRDFGRAIRALLAAQAGLTIVLASLAPFTLFVYISGIGYSQAILWNGLMFAAASASAQNVLKRGYRPLIEQDRRHGVLLRVWLVIYIFVGVQTGWMMRPFVGDPAQPTAFFRQEGFSNAYVSVFQIVLSVLKGQARE